MIKKIALTTLALGLTSAASIAFAQNFPNKPIRLIVPFPPGGTTDLIARSVADRLGRELGQPMIVENRGGGGGSIGANEIAKAAPDGYTIGMATVSTHAVNPACNPRLSYDPLKDFTFITNLAITANVLAVNPKVSANNYQEFLAFLKKNPAKLSYATSGNCSIAHLSGENFKSLTGTFMLHIPYRGSGPALNDVVAGQVEILIDNLPSSMPQIQAGKLRPIAIAWNKRVDNLPNVPTWAELGLASMNSPAWYGLVAPPNLPKDVQEKIRAAALKVLAQPDLRERFKGQGAEAVGDTPEQFQATVRAELERARTVVKKQSIKFEGS